MSARTWRIAPALAALVVAACTSSTTQTAFHSPAQSPSASASSPAASPSASPTGGSQTPTSTPSSTPTSSSAALSIQAPSFHAGEVGLNYAPIAFGAAGGTPPYVFSLTGGSLPPGLGLSAGGLVSGTPTGSGKPSFTVAVTDSVGATASAPGSINVFARLAVSAPCANQCSVEEGCTVCGSFGSASGGQSPYRYTVTANNAPPGMKISGLGLTGAFPPPGPLGQYNVTVVVTDQLGVQGTVPANWFVFSHIAFSGGLVRCPYPVSPCRVQFAYSGGTPGGAISTKVTIASYSQTCVTGSPCPPPPDTVTGSAANGVVTITVVLKAGSNPNWLSNGWTGTLAVVLTDSSPCGPGNCNTGNVAVPISVGAG